MTTQASPASIKSALLAKRNLRCSRTEWYGKHLGPAAATVRSTHGMK